MQPDSKQDSNPIPRSRSAPELLNEALAISLMADDHAVEVWYWALEESERDALKAWALEVQENAIQVMQELAEWITNALIPVARQVAELFDKLPPEAQSFAETSLYPDTKFEPMTLAPEADRSIEFENYCVLRSTRNPFSLS